MQPVFRFFDKIRKPSKCLALSGAALLQALLSVAADTPVLDKQENLCLRKITEYWREGNYINAKTHILNYLNTYPTSSYLNELYAMLGDLSFKDKSYEEALSIYDKITTPSSKERIALHYMETLFALGKYEDAVAWGRNHPLQTENFHELHRFSLLLAESLYRLAIPMEPGPDQKKIACEALDIYKQIPDDHTHRISLAVAHLCTLIGECDEAGSLYLHLAESLPDKKEELYFRAALQLTTSKPSQALDLFEKVIEQKGPLNLHAVFNRLILLYKQQNFAQFVEEYDRYGAILSDEHDASLLFCRSVSLFQLERFAESVAPLQTLIQTNSLSILQTRRALLSLFFCAQKTSDLELITRCLQMWSDRLYLDENYLQGLFIRVQIAFERKEFAIGATTLQEILERFPNCEERESVLFDYAQTLTLDKRWTEGRESFRQFLKTYPSSPSTPLAWQHLIFSSMQLLKEGSPAEKEALKGCLVIDLQAALASTPALDADTIQVYKRGIAQLNFELGRHEEALREAEEYIQCYPEDNDTQVMRLMATTCLMMLGAPPEDFIAVAETALSHETDLQTQGKLRLQLFNSYLGCAKSNEMALEKASEYLLVVYQDKTAPIKKENLLWLADHLAKNSDTASQAKATAVLEDALEFNGQKIYVVDGIETPLLEIYALRLATLYDKLAMPEKAALLLSSLIELEDTNTGAAWDQRRQVLFSLGELEEKLGRIEHALSVYTRLIDEATYASSSYYRRAALLKRAKLQYNALSNEEKQSDSSALLPILDALKELQITKNIHSEPVHLEAALEYVAMRCAMAAEQGQAEKKLFYLENLQADFLSGADDANAPYHNERLSNPEKDAIFNAYMRFIDLEIKQCNLIKTKETGSLEETLPLETEITLGLRELLSLPAIEKTPLATRVQEALKTLGISL